MSGWHFSLRASTPLFAIVEAIACPGGTVLPPSALMAGGSHTDSLYADHHLPILHLSKFEESVVTR